MIAVDLWIWPLDLPATRLSDLERFLSSPETDRATRFVRRRDRDRFVAARGRMREILARYCGQDPGVLRFEQASHGKPFLRGGPFFNLSHSAGWAALAVSQSGEIGIDIERFRHVEPEVARRFFSDQEVAWLDSLPAGKRQAGFFRCWTRKEAVLKALGTGLTTPLRDFEVTLAPGEDARVSAMRIAGERALDWHLEHLDLAPDFPGAIAAREPMRVKLCEGSLPVALARKACPPDPAGNR